MKTTLPEIYEVMVANRDIFMAKALQEVTQEEVQHIYEVHDCIQVTTSLLLK